MMRDFEAWRYRIKRLARQAVYGNGAQQYYRWTAVQVAKRDLVEPVQGAMLSALLDGEVDKDSPDAERQLIHYGRMQLADIALRVKRQQRQRRSVARSDWIPQGIDPRAPESRDIHRMLTRLHVREMLMSIDEEAFDLMSAYYRAGNHRGAAAVLSAILGRPVSESEYWRELTAARFRVAEWILGYRPHDLGRMPSGRGKHWRRECDEVAEMMMDVRQRRERQGAA